MYVQGAEIGPKPRVFNLKGLRMTYEYYNDQGNFISKHNTSSVPLKKKGGFVIDPQDYEVITKDDVILIRSIPGFWVSIEADSCLSNSAYHRCGVGTSWHAYWEKTKFRHHYTDESMDDDTSLESVEFVSIKIPSCRADQRFNGQIKIPSDVKTFYLSAGKSSSFSSTIVKRNGGSPDLVVSKYCVEDLTPDLIIKENSFEWTPGSTRLFS